MFVRMMMFRIKPEYLSALRTLAVDAIIPNIERSNGCLFATVVWSASDETEFLILTIWDSPQSASHCLLEGYGVELRKTLHPLLADSSEWRLELSKTLKLEEVPVAEEPIIDSYSLDVTSDLEFDREAKPRYVRFVSATIKTGMYDELIRVYREEVMPAVLSVKGCRFAGLVRGIESVNQAISITIWDTREDAENYEMTLYPALIEKTQHTFSDLYQWKLGLDRSLRERIRTSEDVTVESYSVIAATSTR